MGQSKKGTQNKENKNTGDAARPNRVSTAIKLLYLSVVISIVQSFFTSPALDNIPPLALIIFVNMFSLAILSFFIFMAAKGRNWARIVLLVLFIAGIPFFIYSLPRLLLLNPINGILNIGNTILTIIALVFLFQKSSSDWFRLMKSR
ncbi:hypothetical protein HY491_03490 [Candidatus Woesearchaeota archaeon]|nr:hypothetical protein [Candidatus Woesearchaeota archaeon]